MSSGASVFMLALTIGLAGYTSLRIYWNNYRIKLVHTILIGLTYFVFTLWQFLILYYSEDPAIFLSISAVFLTQNVFVRFLWSFLNLSST
jgi:hypothetical protein